MKFSLSMKKNTSRVTEKKYFHPSRKLHREDNLQIIHKDMEFDDVFWARCIEFYLPSLHSIGGDIDLQNNDVLKIASMPQLETVNNLYLANLIIRLIYIDNLSQIHGNIWLENLHNLNAFRLPFIISQQGSIEIRNCNNLQKIDIGNLVDHGHDLNLSGLPALTELNISSLMDVAGTFEFINLAKLQQLDLGELKKVGGRFILYNLPSLQSLDISHLVDVKGYAQIDETIWPAFYEQVSPDLKIHGKLYIARASGTSTEITNPFDPKIGTDSERAKRRATVEEDIALIRHKVERIEQKKRQQKPALSQIAKSLFDPKLTTSEFQNRLEHFLNTTQQELSQAEQKMQSAEKKNIANALTSDAPQTVLKDRLTALIEILSNGEHDAMRDAVLSKLFNSNEQKQILAKPLKKNKHNRLNP